VRSCGSRGSSGGSSKVGWTGSAAACRAPGMSSATRGPADRRTGAGAEAKAHFRAYLSQIKSGVPKRVWN